MDAWLNNMLVGVLESLLSAGSFKFRLNDRIPSKGTRSQIRSGMGHRNPKDNSDYGLEDFFEEVKEVEMLLDKMSSIVHKLQEANEESKSVTKASAMKAIKGRMEMDIVEVGKIARNIKVKLEQMDRNVLMFT